MFTKTDADATTWEGEAEVVAQGLLGSSQTQAAVGLLGTATCMAIWLLHQLRCRTLACFPAVAGLGNFLTSAAPLHRCLCWVGC